MVGHSEGIRDILVAYTGYTGGYHPNSRGINEIDATNKFLVKPKETFDMDTHWRVERYTIDVIAESESTLQTMIDAIQNCATDRPSGYIPSSSNYSLIKQANYDECFTIHIHAGTDPTFVFPDTGLIGDTFAYSSIAKTIKAHVDIELNKGAGSEIGIFQMSIPIPTLIGSSGVTYKLGLYVGGSAYPDPTDPAYIQAVDYDGGYDSAADTGTYEEFSVLSEYTQITDLTNDIYNELDISDILSQYYAKYGNSIVTLVIGYGSIITDMDWYVYRKDSGDVNPDTKFPYVKAIIDTTTSGYPYWIGLGPRSENLDLGPNQFGKRIELLASYEVTSS